MVKTASRRYEVGLLPVCNDLSVVSTLERVVAERHADSDDVLQARSTSDTKKAFSMEVEKHRQIAEGVAREFPNDWIATVRRKPPVDASERVANSVLPRAEEFLTLALYGSR